MEKTGEQVSVLGYGCMRYPQKNGRIDEDRTERQILSAIEQGVNYFDTAYVYHSGRSESILGKILSKGYRNRVNIATKLPPYMVHSKADIGKILDTQLKRLDTDHIDYYLMHALPNMKAWERLKQFGIIEFLEQAKQAGKIRNIGFSYHGDRNEFKSIVDDYDWSFCQIQYNYLDENNQAGKEGLHYASSKGLGVAVMEPLRGGALVGRMPEEINNIWNEAAIKRSPAEWAFRWLWNQPEVSVVLSGLNEESHIDENIRVANEAYPNTLKAEELELFQEVKAVFERLMKVGCTGCGYCMPCPAGVNIPLCFSFYNSKHFFKNRTPQYHYVGFTSGITGGKPSHASLCKDCGKCEKMCPQQLPIRKHLKEVARDMEGILVKPVFWAAGKYYKIRDRFKNS